ncbi:MAG: LysR family transcriptional regulator [Pseudomonadota bacterium]
MPPLSSRNPSKFIGRIGTFRQLEILIAVHQFKSIKRASENLHLTQPTVSMQLKKLSDAIGLPLYHQNGKTLDFTEAGEIMAAAAFEVLERMRYLDMELSELRGLKSGTLRLAVVTTSKYFIPHLLGPFCERYPSIDIEFNVGNRQQIINRLDAGIDDIYVFSNLPERNDIETIDFLDNPLVVLAPENHPLAGNSTISLKRLSEEPFLAREKGSGTRYATEKFLKKAGASMNVRITIESNEAIKHSVMSGLGIAILSEHTLNFGDRNGLIKLNVQQFPIMTKWYLVRLNNRNLSPIAKTFLHYLETEGKESLLKELNN